MSKIGSGGGHTREGAQPNYIPDLQRWRAYHRALKRGEPWAVRLSLMPSFNRCLTWMYGRGDLLRNLINSPNPFLALLKAPGSWISEPVEFPLVWPGVDGHRKRAYYRKHRR